MKTMIKSILCALLAVGAVSAAEIVKMVGLRGLKTSDSELATGRKLGKSDKGNKSGKDGKDNKGDNDNNDRTFVYDRAFYDSDTMNPNRKRGYCSNEPSRAHEMSYLDDECTTQRSEDGSCPQDEICCQGDGEVCVKHNYYLCDRTGTSAQHGTLVLICKGLPQEIPP